MRFSYRFWRLFIRILFLLAARGRAFGAANVPRRGAVLLASNHQSFFDPVLAAAPLARECHFMGRDSLFRNRFFGRLLASVNTFPVKRSTGDVGAIKEALRRLGRGGALVMFPEGTRSPDGRIQALRPGIPAIARRANCPIVPTIIEGAFEMWPRKHRLPRIGRLWVEYGEPIRPEELADLDAAEAIRLLTERLRTLHNRLRIRIGRSAIEYEPPTGALETDQPGDAGEAVAPNG